MKGETVERWRKLCKQAVAERDLDKLIRSIEEIDRLLESKEERLLREQEEAKKQGAA